MSDDSNRLERFQRHWSTSDPRRRSRAYVVKVLYEGGLSFLAAAAFVYIASKGAEIVFGIEMTTTGAIAGFFVVFAAFVSFTFCNLITDLRETEDSTIQSELPRGESEDDEPAQIE